ncbi:hypothetical protein TCAL_04224 [Tigriopus californicus]|uniref:Transmembrane protein 179 n=1 Tax=Tigriopus californicus TaxID=6832 RepID=A0A553PMG6_TIGCA|nr:transmembrane protein 179-like [Tigriopus californicus]TRY78884.1 hypothetical protein TCAL_04224 [Tigriopus californicus]|eukprot:TCALIF_04224-PA protein Name:"Similar to TMEM179 Transmembrane protein 179 (Homo sapiens)" AED:0.14 eAED:0.14 QI:0/-1/0/1/-1/1/1/0/313
MPNYSSQVILCIQGVSYLCGLILSLCVCVPMAIHQEHFKGHCLLFSTGRWQEADGQFKVDWASQAYCNFTIFVAVVQFVLSLCQFVRICKYFKRGTDASFLGAFVDVICGVLITVVTLIAALFVTCGFKVWCGEMTRRFQTCQDATANDIDKADGIDTSGFYNQMFTAQFGIWMSFTAYCNALVFSMVKLCRYHHEENLRVSMAKERKRLINEDIVTEVPVMARDETQASASRRRRRGDRSSGPPPSTAPIMPPALQSEDPDQILSVEGIDNPGAPGAARPTPPTAGHAIPASPMDTPPSPTGGGNQIRLSPE